MTPRQIDIVQARSKSVSPISDIAAQLTFAVKQAWTETYMTLAGVMKQAACAAA